ncbi:MAG: hypothetical protein JST90_11920 [Bacteroidetes bacterium]|nr:hypothetical protein [Bacteroidota bacterium]
MKYPASTVRISYYRAKDIGANQEWIDWAFEMIDAGFETESLLYLASFSESESSWHVREIGNKALLELGIVAVEIETAMIGYATSLVQMAVESKINPLTALTKLCKIYDDNRQVGSLKDFFLLYYAKTDLADSEMQLYWTAATRENIDSIISDYFKQWLSTHQESTLPLD